MAVGLGTSQGGMASVLPSVAFDADYASFLIEDGPPAAVRPSPLGLIDPPFRPIPDAITGLESIAVQAPAAPTDAWDRLENRFIELLAAAPLVLIAIIVFLAVFLLSRVVSRRLPIPEALVKSSFQQQILRQTVQAMVILVGLLIALEIVNASSLIGAVLGAAGVTGIVLGFALKDTIENYVSGLLLSWRQPFAPNDLVLVQGYEGHVVRLTSRATVLLTLAGNHVRIPNADVVKSPLVNYSRNPERRFEFEIGVGVDVDLAAAQKLAIETLAAMPAVLAEPEPDAWIESLGDSNVILKVAGWVDQRRYAFVNVRGEAIRKTKTAFEAAEFDLPEPIYRLRLMKAREATGAMGTPVGGAKPAQAAVTPAVEEDERLLRDHDLDQKVARERTEMGEEDLLDPNGPKE